MPCCSEPDGSCLRKQAAPRLSGSHPRVRQEICRQFHGGAVAGTQNNLEGSDAETLESKNTAVVFMTCPALSCRKSSIFDPTASRCIDMSREVAC